MATIDQTLTDLEADARRWRWFCALALERGQVMLIAKYENDSLRESCGDAKSKADLDRSVDAAMKCDLESYVCPKCGGKAFGIAGPNLVWCRATTEDGTQCDWSGPWEGVTRADR